MLVKSMSAMTTFIECHMVEQDDNIFNVSFGPLIPAKEII